MKHKTKSLFVVLALVFSGTLFAQKEVYKDMDAPQHERIMDLLSRLTIEEKISLLRRPLRNSRLEIEKYYHGNEALHGIVRPGNFTVFPQAIGLASMWNPDFLYEISTVISDEARARWNELNRERIRNVFSAIC